MRKIKFLLVISIFTFLFSSFGVIAFHSYTFIEISIPALSKIYREEKIVDKDDSSTQYIETIDAFDKFEKQHAIQARVTLCLETTTNGKDCVGEKRWTDATIGKKVALKDSAGSGRYSINFKTKGTQVVSTSYWGTWIWDSRTK